MILATYQSLNYLTWKNKKYSKLKELLSISQDTNLYWCISANNIYQAVINTYTTVANQPSLFIMFETEKFYKLDAIKWNHYVETQDETYEIIIRHAAIYMNYNDIKTLYKKYKDFYNFIYNKLFMISKIYPNDSCPCKSGFKYKKCCMKNNKILYRYMTEK